MDREIDERKRDSQRDRGKDLREIERDRSERDRVTER